MNILLLTTHLNYGGITSYIKSLAKGLKLRGHNVFVASSGGDCLEFFENLGIEHILIPIRTKSEISPKVLLSLLRLLPNLKEKNIQIIHSHTRVTQVLSFFLSKFGKIPYITTCHGFFKPRFFRRLFPCWGEKVIAISESVRKHLTRDFKMKEEIRLIYNGIDTERFKIQNEESKVELKREFGLDNYLVIGIVSRLSEVKGHRFLIKAFSRILEIFPQVKLLIVGEGKEKERLLRIIEELKIKESVLFLPSVSDTQKILSLMDIFCLPTLSEGLGLSLMEAMGCGLPVIASKIGGIQDLIKDGQTGLLVEPASIDELKEKILILLKDRVQAKRMGEEASKYIREKFSLVEMVKKIEGVYKECIGEL